MYLDLTFFYAITGEVFIGLIAIYKFIHVFKVFRAGG